MSPDDDLTDEMLYVLACVWADKYKADAKGRDDCVRWLAGKYPLNLIEDAAWLAFDPPVRVDYGALNMLLQVRAWARRGVPRSTEVAQTNPNGTFVVEDDLYERVAEAFEDIELNP